MVPAWAGFVLCLLLQGGWAWGQAVPEQPDWNQGNVAEGQATDTPSPAVLPSPPAQTQRPPSAANQTSTATAGPPTVAKPQASVSSTTLNAMQNETATAENDAAEVGVPNGSDFFLPNFVDYGRPFFERQGLRFRAGPLYFNVSLSISEEYNDNVSATANNTTGSLITRISPYFQLGIGDFKTKNEDYLLVDYRPSYDYYFSFPEYNRLNQGLNLEGRATFSRYITTVTLSYVNSDSPDATQTNRQGYQIVNLTWDNSYYLTAKTFARLTLTGLEQSYESSSSYTTLSANPMMGYEFSPKTTFTFGPYAGTAYIGASEDGGEAGTQSFQGFTMGIIYDNLSKVKFQGVFGIQSRQYHGANASGASNFTTPVFDFTATYALSQKTSLSLELVRNVQISDLIQGLTYTNSALQFSFAHQLSAHLNFTLGVDYQYLEYQGQSPAGRTDGFLLINPSLGYSFWRDQCSLNVYYQRQQRTSTVANYEYTVNTYGIQFVVRF